MEKIKFDINKYQREEKPTEEWKELGKELTDYFGKNCYWLPWKFPIWKIRQQFKTIQELEKKDFKYFIGMLKSK